jgi:DNA-binding MarR family transcriptional regulator
MTRPHATTAPATETATELHLFASRLVRQQRAASVFPFHQLTVLGRLSREGALTTSQLAAEERVRQQSMAQTVADMAANDLVRRRPDPTDGRKVLLEITEAGEAVLRRERQARMAWLAAAIEDRLDPEERGLLDKSVALLHRLVET